MAYKEDDVNLLLPTMKAVVLELKADLVAEGFDVCVRDTVRTKAEAAANAARGVGIADSMHIYGPAADLICNKHGWDCAAKGCKFFVRLDVLARARGLFRVMLKTKAGKPYLDAPHVQGIPATKEAQDAIRKLGTSKDTVEARDALVRRHLKR